MHMAALLDVGVLALTAIVVAPAVQADNTFAAADVNGALDEDPTVEATEDAAGEIERAEFEAIGLLSRRCGCTNDDFDFEPASLDNIRAFSDAQMGGGDVPSSVGISNLVWAWGQFMDHDLVTTVDVEDGPEYEITLTIDGEPSDSIMIVHRLEVEMDGDTQCRMPVVINTPQIDGGTVYGSDETYLQEVLREPGTCELRTSAGNLLPVTTNPDDDGLHFLVAGDTRVNEHGMIAAMHTVWVREHNRLCEAFDADPEFAALSEDDQFEKARQIVIAKFQHITLTQFLPTLGITEQTVRSHTPEQNVADIGVEFFVAYRMGHDMIPDTIGPIDTVEIFNGDEFMGVTGSPESDDPTAANADMDALLEAAAGNVANEVDGLFSDAIRDTLFGEFGEDLISRNIFRGRDIGLPGYGELAECYGVTPNAEVSAETDDAFLGLLRENQEPGVEVLGPTLAGILIDQFHRSFFGAGGQYWEDDAAHLAAVEGFAAEIRGTSLGTVITANTGVTIAGNGFMAGGVVEAVEDEEVAEIVEEDEDDVNDNN